LTIVNSIATGAGPTSIVVDKSGSFLYTANNGASSVSAFSINSSTGELSLLGTQATGASPNGIVVVAY
jgi:6-phosphogluconolactonase